jgi:hypothetical protein
MPGLESPMKLDIAMLVNIALFNKLILDVNIGALFFDSHFAEPRCNMEKEEEKKKEKKEKTRENKRNLTTQQRRTASSRDPMQPRSKA